MCVGGGGGGGGGLDHNPDKADTKLNKAHRNLYHQGYI